MIKDQCDKCGINFKDGDHVAFCQNGCCAYHLECLKNENN